MAPAFAKYTRPYRINAWFREFERRIEHTRLGFLAELTSKDHPLNPVRPYPAVGGSPAIHAQELNEKEVLLAMSKRGGHTLCMETTRGGNSRLAEILTDQ